MAKSNFMVGMISGAVIGSVVGMMIDPIKDKQGKTIKKGATRAFRTLGSVIDTFIDN